MRVIAKAVYGKTVCTVRAADGGQRLLTARLLRPVSVERSDQWLVIYLQGRVK